MNALLFILPCVGLALVLLPFARIGAWLDHTKLGVWLNDRLGGWS